MSNWDLMMPGMGLTGIGLAGVIISYAGIANTFLDGMHALTGLTMFFGLIFLSAGILEGGVSTSNKAKATTLVILTIAVSFGIVALTMSESSILPSFVGIMMIIFYFIGDFGSYSSMDSKLTFKFLVEGIFFLWVLSLVYTGMIDFIFGAINENILKKENV